jgi:glycosyltransferase involved in cell wall biosynthesis
VLHVDSARTWRGGQNQVLLTAAGMRERGHEVALACRPDGVLGARAAAESLAVRPVAFRGDFWPPAVRSLARAVRELAPQVVQLHDPHAVSAGWLAAALIARRPRGLRPPLWIATRRVDFPLRSALSRRKYRSVRRVVAVSRAIARVLERDGLETDRIRLVYEGVPDRLPVSGGRERLAGLGVPPDALVVANVAALTAHKDQRTLVEAAALLARDVPALRVVVFGEGEERPALEALVRDRGLGGTVVLAGFREDLDRVLPACDVFCLSSRLEGLGTSLLDAMAFGLPVVATAAGGIPEAVEDGITGRLVPVRNPRALAGALRDVAADPALRRRLGEAGRRRFLERFTASAMVEATLAVYREAA